MTQANLSKIKNFHLNMVQNFRLLAFLIVIIIFNLFLGACASAPKLDPYKIVVYAHKGQIDEVQKYLDSGYPINSQDEQGHTLLHYSLNANQIEMAKYLLQKGANPNIEDVFGVTAFDIVLVRRHLSLFDLMIQSGADVNLVHKDGTLPLHFAIDSGYLPMVTLLTVQGAKLDLKGPDGLTPVEYAKEEPEIYHYLKGLQ